MRPAIDFVVIGGQKAGSTHLAACLASHPELYVCPDEVPYFEDPYYGNSAPDELARALRRARPGQRRGIHRPEYVAHAEAAVHIAHDAPGARALAVLRDPVDRAVAAYYWYVQFDLLPLLPADVGLQRLLEGWRDPRYPHAAEVLDYGRYAHHLSPWVAALGAERVLVLATDGLRRPDTFAGVFRFLGVDDSHVPAAIDARTNPGVYDLRRLRWLRLRAGLAFSWDSTDTYRYRRRRWRQPLRSIPTAAVVAVDRAVLAPVVARGAGASRPPLPPDLEQALRDYYAADLAALTALAARCGWPAPPWAPAGDSH